MKLTEAAAQVLHGVDPLVNLVRLHGVLVSLVEHLALAAGEGLRKISSDGFGLAKLHSVIEIEDRNLAELVLALGLVGSELLEGDHLVFILDVGVMEDEAEPDGAAVDGEVLE
eukprot:CAMPEP_0170492240 /NCGR_PEP_ID=MMETSP0208-20121228/11901_1 /TAXON_ID=197538 /ORGANISM="Strombidium inclinatum, Strain S3" /LENGTH=112 /DNA_ID=CAMNT_0010767947 /DNA_START=320 /DNA_END=654 /DNA_ORIENTATION=-